MPCIVSVNETLSYYPKQFLNAWIKDGIQIQAKDTERGFCEDMTAMDTLS
jgi:hypothetical protein